MPKSVTELMNQTEELHRDFKKNILGTNYSGKMPVFDTHFNIIKAHLKAIGAVVEPSMEQAPRRRFPPMTDVLGSPIAIRQTPTQEGNPQAFALERMRARKDKLWAEFEKLGGVEVLKSYTSKEDIEIVRAVAKYAKVPNWKQRNMTLEFMNLIIAGINKVEKEKEMAAKVNEGLNKTNEPGADDDNDDLDDDDLTQSSAIVLPGAGTKAGMGGKQSNQKVG